MKHDREPRLVQAYVDPLIPRFCVRSAIEDEVYRDDLIHWGRTPHVAATVPDYFVEAPARTKLFKFVIESIVL